MISNPSQYRMTSATVAPSARSNAHNKLASERACVDGWIVEHLELDAPLRQIGDNAIEVRGRRRAKRSSLVTASVSPSRRYSRQAFNAGRPASTQNAFLRLIDPRPSPGHSLAAMVPLRRLAKGTDCTHGSLKQRRRREALGPRLAKGTLVDDQEIFDGSYSLVCCWYGGLGLASIANEPASAAELIRSNSGRKERWRR